MIWAIMLWSRLIAGRTYSEAEELNCSQFRVFQVKMIGGGEWREPRMEAKSGYNYGHGIQRT